MISFCKWVYNNNIEAENDGRFIFKEVVFMNPVAFSLFGFDVRWYGILISVGMILATIITIKRAGNYGIDSEKVLDIILIAIPVGIIGTRLYYVAFNWDLYKGDFLKIINIREGGLAIHGGLIFGIAAAAIVCSRMGIKVLRALDIAMPGISLAQSIGRWGNFFNQEAYGGPTNLPWAIVVNGQHVHPTFLYESICTFLLFLFLLYADARKKFDGQIFLLYGIFYSLARFFIEGLRTDSLMLGPFRVAQVVSACIFVLFAVIYIRMYMRRKNRMFRY